MRETDFLWIIRPSDWRNIVVTKPRFEIGSYVFNALTSNDVQNIVIEEFLADTA